jgi:hypothetical protein
MKNLLRSLLFVFFVGALLTAQSARAAPFVSSHGYSFTPAPGWRVDRGGMMHTDVIVFAPAIDKFSPNFNVLFSPAPAGQMLEVIQQQVATMYPRMFKGIKVISSTIGNLGGVKALDLFASYPAGTKTLRMRQAIVIYKGHVYTFTCTSPEATHVRYDDAFTHMLESVRWSK